MPAPTTAPEILELLERSGLLNATTLETIREQVNESDSPVPNPRVIIQELVRQYVLTPFQAKKLAAGVSDGFFLGKYRLLDLLGAGGMGKVFLAEQTSLKRAVALKVLPVRRGEHGSNLVRFGREARAVAKLRHPNITQAYDFDQVGSIYYIAMEYVEGVDLQFLVDRAGPLEPGLAAHLIAQAANGLEHARQHNLVHRDVKPGNIMVELSGLVKLLDLGLVATQEAETLTLNEQDVVIGTADYIAPEQAINSHDVDIRADIYSLGATLYFILTGKTLFPCKTVAEKLMHHQTQQPKPVRELAPHVPEKLAAVLEKMMAKKPDDRYTTPREVREALQPFAKPARNPFDRALIRYPRTLLQKYLRVGGEGPPSSRRMSQSMAEPESPEQLAETEPRTSAMTSEFTPSPGSKPVRLQVGNLSDQPRSGSTVPVVNESVPDQAASSSPSSPRLPHPHSHLGLWLAIATAAVLAGTVAALVVVLGFGGESTTRPQSPAVPPVVQAPAAPAPSGQNATADMILGPNAQDVPVGFALRSAPAGGVVQLLERPEDWSPDPIHLRGGDENGGRVTLVGRGGNVVLWGNPGAPIFRLTDVEGFTLSNVILDGAGQSGPLIEIEGQAAGVMLKNVTLRNVTGEAIRLVSAKGTSDNPVRLIGIKSEGGRRVTPISFRAPALERAREVGDRSEHIQILHGQFNDSFRGIHIAQPVESIEVRNCTFTKGRNAITFDTHLPVGQESRLQPLTNWQVAGWWPNGEEPPLPTNGPIEPHTDRFEFVSADQAGGRVDLTRLLGGQEHASALAYTEFDSLETDTKRIFVGADDEVILWVNGAKAFEHRGHQSHHPAEFTDTAMFRQGINHIWAEIRNGEQGASFSVSIAEGNTPVTRPKWRAVTLTQNTIQGYDKAVVFTTTPTADSTVTLTENHFHQIRHYPVLVRRTSLPVMPGVFTVRDNSDREHPPGDREQFKDSSGFELIPLNEGEHP